MNGMTVNDPGKLIVVLVAIVGGFLLAIVGLIMEDQGAMTSGVGVVSTAIGYVLGNGRLASRSEPPATLMSPVLPEHEYVARADLEALVAAKNVERVNRSSARRKAAVK